MRPDALWRKRNCRLDNGSCPTELEYMISPSNRKGMNASQPQVLHPAAHCGLTDLFQGSDINSPHPSRSDVDGTCAKMLNFSQTGGMFASQEFGCGSASRELICSSSSSRRVRQFASGCSTQDFATPHHGYQPRASQSMSQPVVIPELAFGAPPTFDGAGKRGRATYECAPSQGKWVQHTIIQRW